jgi:hypothetical protein
MRKNLNNRFRQSSKKVLLLCLVTMAVIGSFNACKKYAPASKEIARENNGEFNTAAAREWYYGHFKKTNNWKSYDPDVQGKKLPDWEHGRYHRTGTLEIAEFPLEQAKRSYGIAGTGLNDQAKEKIAAASQSRILFIKKADGSILVREADYVPDWEYLDKKGYDISNVQMGKPENDFTGRLTIKRWNETEVSKWQVKDGKLKRQLSLQTKSADSSSTGSKTLCNDFLLITTWAQNCIDFYRGDQLIKEVCGNWMPVSSQVEPNCDFVWDGDPCENVTADECLCMLYSICQSNGNEEENCQAPNLQSVINASTSVNEIYQGDWGPEFIDIATGKRTRIGTFIWYFNKTTFLGFSFNWKSTEEGRAVFVDGEWKIASFSHKYHEMEGSFPPCTEVSADVTAYPTIALNGRSATMELRYKLTAYTGCCVSIPIASGNFIGSHTEPAP